MKKVIILDETDYNAIICHLDNIQNIAYRMRNSENKLSIEYHSDAALSLLMKEECENQKPDFTNHDGSHDYD